MILNFDESGNMGKDGRHFVIACVGSDNIKPLSKVMKKATQKTKNSFVRFSNAKEIKASDSTGIIKDYILRKIASKQVDIKYVVADLEHVNQNLKEDENILYNYLLSFLVLPLARKTKKLELNLDKRTIKVKSTNSFEDYIKLEINYKMELDVDIKVNYIESQNSYAVQAADFIANAIYTKYEYNNDYFYNIIKSNVTHRELFPRRRFGTPKVVNLTP
jgi:hypothetical protein